MKTLVLVAVIALVAMVSGRHLGHLGPVFNLRTCIPYYRVCAIGTGRPLGKVSISFI